MALAFKYLWSLRGYLILCTAVLTVSSAPQNQWPKEFSVVADFVQTFLKPFLRTANILPELINSTISVKEDTKMEKVIRKEVKRLQQQQLLQDDDENTDTDNNLTLHGNDETTVIEFLPDDLKFHEADIEQAAKRSKSDPVKIHMNKYKRIREQIKTMLDQEYVAEETKTLIIKTLDELIAQMVESNCKWNTERGLYEARNATNKAIAKLHTMTKQQWDDLRQQYLDYLNSRKKQENKFINQFHQFFSTVINDTYHMAGRYKVKCQLFNTQEKRKEISALRGAKIKPECEQFKVCSGELREFFKEFYKNVNDTTVSTFTNYGAMYIRDINIDPNKLIVESTVNNIAQKAGNTVKQIYKKDISKFRLDPKKSKIENIKRITNFIKSVIKNVKEIVSRSIQTELKKKEYKIFVSVKNDLTLNLDTDLDDLEQHYRQSVCKMFLGCNGRYSTRRMEQPWGFKPKANDEVYVKVQLSLDDEMKDVVQRSGVLNLLQQSGHLKYTIGKNPMRLYSGNAINVTRTKNLPHFTKTHKLTTKTFTLKSATLLNTTHLFLKENEI